MIKTIVLASAASLLCSGAVAAEYQLKPQESGSEIFFVAEAQRTVPNDQAVIYLSATADSKSLPDAQSQVNELMAKAASTIKDFSSLAEVESAGYETRPIYSEPSGSKTRKITGWQAVQRIKVRTVDVEGVPALVQMAQNANLGVSSLSYGLTRETKRRTDEDLVADVVQDVNKKAADIALAMQLPVESFVIEKLDFNSSSGVLLGRTHNASLAASDGKASVLLPSFDPGASTVSMRAEATMKEKPNPRYQDNILSLNSMLIIGSLGMKLRCIC